MRYGEFYTGNIEFLNTAVFDKVLPRSLIWRVRFRHHRFIVVQFSLSVSVKGFPPDVFLGVCCRIVFHLWMKVFMFFVTVWIGFLASSETELESACPACHDRSWHSVLIIHRCVDLIYFSILKSIPIYEI